MFGFFRKQAAKVMDSRRTTDECLREWFVTPKHEQLIVAQNILRLSRSILDECTTPPDAHVMLSGYKTKVIVQYSLKDYRHPAFIQIQILMDLLYTDKRIGTEHFKYTLSVFKTFIEQLTTTEKQELESNLKKFIQSDNFSLAPAGEQKPSNEIVQHASLGADEQRISQHICRGLDEGALSIIRKREAINHTSALTIAPSDKNNVAKDDFEFWQQAIDEHHYKTYPRELWAECFAQANGDEVKAKSKFLTQRVQQLAEDASARALVAEPAINIPQTNAQSNSDKELDAMPPLERAQYEYENKEYPKLLARCIAASNDSDVYAKALYLKTRIIELQHRYAYLDELNKPEKLRSALRDALSFVNQAAKSARASGNVQSPITQIHELRIQLRKACKLKSMDEQTLNYLQSQIWDLFDLELNGDVRDSLNLAQDSLNDCDKYLAALSSTNAPDPAIESANLSDVEAVATDDDELWEQAFNELEQQTYQRGLWAKCFAQANGDEQKAKANYLKQRVLGLSADVNQKMAVPTPKIKQDAPTTTAENASRNLGWPDIVSDNFTAMRQACDCCGASVSLPRYAPRANREGHNYPPMLQTKNYMPAPPIPDDEIIRFSDSELERFRNSPGSWLKGGDGWDPWEIDALIEVGHVCSHESEPSNHNVPRVVAAGKPSTALRKTLDQGGISPEELQKRYAAIKAALKKVDEAAQSEQETRIPSTSLSLIEDFQIKLSNAGQRRWIDTEFIKSLFAIADDLSTDYDPNDSYDIWAPLYEAAAILKECMASSDSKSD